MDNNQRISVHNYKNIKSLVKKLCIFLFFLLPLLSGCSGTGTASSGSEGKITDALMGHRFLTFNSVIRVNQIEVSRDKNVGFDERALHTPSGVIAFRRAIENGFPGARITWAFSWLALHDTTSDYREIRKLVVGYHYKYGDEITFIPGAYFANAYNTTEQVNKDLHEGFADGFNSRMGVGPIETLGKYGPETGLKEMLHSTAIHFEKGFDLNGFAWVTNCWELSLPIDVEGLTSWLSEIKKRWPDTEFITQGEFGLIWREHYKANDFNYLFEETGSGIGGSDAGMKIRWMMNKTFRLALLTDTVNNKEEMVIDFTRYDLKAAEPQSASTRSWSLLGEINQKQLRPRDKPVPLKDLDEGAKSIISKYYPDLTEK
jgi:hypothetical protein